MSTPVQTLGPKWGAGWYIQLASELWPIYEFVSDQLEETRYHCSSTTSACVLYDWLSICLRLIRHEIGITSRRRSNSVTYDSHRERLKQTI